MPNQKLRITIDSILGGHAPLKYVSGTGQFLSSIAIDSDQPVDFGASDVRAGGQITPMIYKDFSGAALNNPPMWLLTNPKDTNLYAYLDNGKVVSYSSALTSASEGTVGTPTSGSGNGAAYYNNYLYFATPTDISRYGPLDGTPALANTFWTSTLSLTALTNASTPSIRGSIAYPNHAMHVHTDNKLYICDFKNGQGVIHALRTQKSSAEGDTDNGSAYNVLDLPFGYIPTDIESYGTDIVISAIFTSDNTIRQGESALFFWDTTSKSFYKQLPVKETLTTALLNANGILYVFSGNPNNGVSVQRYVGGYSLETVVFVEEGYSPPAGAVDYYGNRVVWGGSTTFPEATASVYSLGYKSQLLPANALHNIIRTEAASTTPIVSALKYVQQASAISPRVVVGWGSGATYGLEKLDSSGTMDALWLSALQNIGQRFKITKIRIPLSTAVASNVSIVPKVIVDDGATTFTLPTINTTNFARSQRNIVFTAAKLEANSSGAVRGEHNFYFELDFGGSTHISVMLPITIELELLPDDTAQ